MQTMESAEPYARLARLAQIPCPQPGINPRADDRVVLARMPVDIRDGTVVRVQYVLYRRLALQHEIPY